MNCHDIHATNELQGLIEFAFRLCRMQLEMALWGELGSKLATTRSALEAFDAYSKCVAQQMKMTAEDAQRLVKDFQYMTQKVTQSLRG